jgi:hypothetical protein
MLAAGKAEMRRENPAPAVGVSEEFRGEFEGNRLASALAYAGSVVNGSLVAAV